ncbi:phosphate signaling complex protein PhoU [Anaerolinea thermophila]|jgi:phosphate transport system protein|uniref:phosphate signaling complex protein PhoU n=1 Tax=Anaerolinea thermophila TaxID=167964 RepID=UPI002608AAC7|nr:phosphate signaling complex protein PhoU [Anaerolinea thermophila]
MPRATLDRQLHQIQDEVLTLGSMVEQALVKSVDALKRRDVTAAQQVIRGDQAVNEKRYAIENGIIAVVATQQPMAHDLRFLAAVLEVIIELERIGDYAKGIARVCQRLEGVEIPIPSRDFERMAEITVSMLHRSLSAFVKEDASLAHRIPDEDEQVDALYNSVYHGLITSMIQHPEWIDHSNLLLWVAHNLERAADRVTNICERTVFIATGELLEMDLDDYEETE